MFLRHDIYTEHIQYHTIYRCQWQKRETLKACLKRKNLQFTSVQFIMRSEQAEFNLVRSL